jgi:MoxR-like ATPase
MPRNGSMVNVPGPLAIAARDNKEILFQEIDRFSEECMSIVGMAADDVDTRVIAWAGDDDAMNEYHPTPPYRVLATLNKGPEAMTEALASRFMWIHVDEPAPEALAGLPKHHQEAARVLAGHPDQAQRVSLRSFRRHAQMLTEGFTAEQAARACFGERWDSFIDADRLAGLVDQAMSDL